MKNYKGYILTQTERADIKPGIYFVSQSGEECLEKNIWERLKDFSGKIRKVLTGEKTSDSQRPSGNESDEIPENPLIVISEEKDNEDELVDTLRQSTKKTSANNTDEIPEDDTAEMSEEDMRRIREEDTREMPEDDTTEMSEEEMRRIWEEDPQEMSEEEMRRIQMQASEVKTEEPPENNRLIDTLRQSRKNK